MKTITILSGLRSTSVRFAAFAAVASLALLPACGSSSDGAPSASSAAPVATDDAGSVAPTADAATSSSLAWSDDGETLTLTMGPFSVPAGAEVYKCQDFLNPFGGDQDVDRYEVHMDRGSHHSFLFFLQQDDPMLFGQTVKNTGVTNCALGGLDYHPYPISTQSPEGTLTYPPGVGSRIPASTALRVNAHYVNPSTSDLTATVHMVVHKAKAGTINQYAGAIFLNQAQMSVPPGIHDTTGSMVLGSDIKLLVASSHMHQRATNFVATTDTGEPIYQTTEWDEPVPAFFPDGMPLAKGTKILWTCTYNNETQKTLTFGELASKNVMCIFSGQYFPVADPSQPTISAGEDRR